MGTFDFIQAEIMAAKINKRCVQPQVVGTGCGKGIDPTTEFRDELSKKEYLISGLCQSCQDTIFGKISNATGLTSREDIAAYESWIAEKNEEDYLRTSAEHSEGEFI